MIHINMFPIDNARKRVYRLECFRNFETALGRQKNDEKRDCELQKALQYILVPRKDTVPDIKQRFEHAVELVVRSGDVSLLIVCSISGTRGSRAPVGLRGNTTTDTRTGTRRNGNGTEYGTLTITTTIKVTVR